METNINDTNYKKRSETSLKEKERMKMRIQKENV